MNDSNNRYVVSFIGESRNEFDKFAKLVSSDKNAKFMKKKGQWLVQYITKENIEKTIDPSSVLIKSYEDFSIGKDLKLSLFPYQKEVVDFCLNIENGIIVVPCGAGKTPMGIDIFIDAKKRGLISSSAIGLIVVKASLKIQWLKEVGKFSNLNASVIDTYNSINPYSKKKLKKMKKELESLLLNVDANSEKIIEYDTKIKELEEKIEKEFNSMFDGYDLLIANYETLRDEVVRKKLHKMNLEYIFCDEVQCIKNDTSSRSKAIYEFSDVKMKFGATATPIQKNPLDAYAIVKFVSPTTFKSKTAFSSRYLKFSGFGKITGSKNEKELNKILSEFMIVKEKEEVAKQLPKLFQIARYCKLEPKQQEMTDKILKELNDLKEQEKNLLAKIGACGGNPNSNEELLKIQANIMARQTFASELATCEELLELSESSLAKQYVTGSKSNKIELLLELLEDIIDSGEKAVVFSKYRKLQDILEREILKRFPEIKIARINGTLSAQERYEEAYTKFRDTDEYKVLLCSDAGAEGINAHKSSYLIEMEPADSYLIQTQRRGRIERADSIFDTVYSYQLIAEKSYDEIALKIIEKKEKYDSQIIKGNLG